MDQKLEIGLDVMKECLTVSVGNSQGAMIVDIPVGEARVIGHVILDLTARLYELVRARAGTAEISEEAA